MKGKCSEPNCPNVVYRRGLCRRHWEAIREAERRAYEEAQRQKEEDNQRVLREMERNPHGGSIFHRSYIPSKKSLTQERYTTATASGRFFGAEGR